jgi:hypothetical protein
MLLLKAEPQIIALVAGDVDGAYMIRTSHDERSMRLALGAMLMIVVGAFVVATSPITCVMSPRLVMEGGDHDG